MRIIKSHRLRGKTIAAAQRAHTENQASPALAQQRMVDIFERYLGKKPSDKCLDKAQTLLNHHFTNRTRAEKQNFTTNLFAVCARRDLRFAAALPLAQLCDMPRSLARIQVIADCRHAEVGLNAGALEKAYVTVFERERIAEALTFHFANMLSLEDMQAAVGFFTDPAVSAAREHIAALLRGTPEAEPLGIDLVGLSLTNTYLEANPPGPLAGVEPAIEAKVRALLRATWSPSVSLAGMLALCRGLRHAELDLLLGFCASQTHQALLNACESFATGLPGVRQPAFDAGLTEAFRDHTRAAPGGGKGDANAPAPT